MDNDGGVAMAMMRVDGGWGGGSMVPRRTDSILLGRQGAKLDGGTHPQTVVVFQFAGITVDSNADEGVHGVVEELNEGRGDEGGVDELEDKAAAADAELQGGDWIIAVTAVVRAPLDVETDDEAVDAAAVDVGDPRVDESGGVSDEGLDSVVEEVDIVKVVRSVGYVVVDNGGTHG
ncbi:hypothetical protein U1Q18_007818 [Sarracenia purpurea var. burkii]